MCGGKGTLYTDGEDEVDEATMGNSVAFSQKIKNRTAIWSSYFPMKYASKGNEINIPKWYLPPYGHCSIIYSSQDIETTYMSIDRRMDKDNVRERGRKWNIIQS